MPSIVTLPWERLILSSSRRSSMPKSGWDKIICPSILNCMMVIALCIFLPDWYLRSDASPGLNSDKHSAHGNRDMDHPHNIPSPVWQAAKIDAIALLQGRQIAVARRNTDDIANARSASCRCSHPQDVMIAPLDIHGMMVHKRIQDQVWAWPLS